MSRPAAASAFGDIIIPARSDNTASKGENGVERVELHRMGIDDIDRGDGFQFRLARAFRGGPVAVQIGLHGGGIEALAVVEGDAVAQG